MGIWQYYYIFPLCIGGHGVKKCKVCKTPFESFNSLIGHCSPKCGYELHRKNQDKKHRKEKAKFRNDDKSISKLRSEAQAAINAYVRLRDYHKSCICCGVKDSPQWDAGHYRSRGSAKHLAFNLNNIHKQAVKCNRYLGGNYSEYRIGLINRIGLDKVEALETNNAVRRFDKEYLERLKKIFNKKARMKKKRLGL